MTECNCEQLTEKEIGKRFCLPEKSAGEIIPMIKSRIEEFILSEEEEKVKGLLDDIFVTDKSLWYIGEIWGIDFPFEILVESEVSQVKKACPDIWPQEEAKDPEPVLA